MLTHKLLPLDLGDRWYTVEARPGVKHWDRGLLLREGFAASDITCHDTRLTLREVGRQLQKRIESEPTFADCPPEWFGPCGGGACDNDLWPVDERVVVTVVQGGNEGYYVEVHIMKRDDERNGYHARCLLSGKFFNFVPLWRVAAAVSGWLGLTPLT